MQITEVNMHTCCTQGTVETDKCCIWYSFVTASLFLYMCIVTMFTKRCVSVITDEG